jgi:hypothetical protein
MRALLLDYTERRLRLDNRVAEPPEGEVYLRVLECGICGFAGQTAIWRRSIVSFRQACVTKYGRHR